MSEDDDMREHMTLVTFMNRFPQLPKALASLQTTFDIVAKPTDRDMKFITRCVDSPLQAEGRLGPDGVWRVSSYLLPAPENEADVEDAVAREADGEILAIVDGLAEAMIRDAIPKVLEQMTDDKVRAVFERRLAATRFADGITIH
jgi:hypothetical protein